MTTPSQVVQQRAALQDTLRVAEEAANANPGNQAALAAVETARKALSDFEARVLASATVGGVPPSAPPAGGASSSSATSFDQPGKITWQGHPSARVPNKGK